MSSRTETLASRLTARFAQELRALPALPGDVAFEVDASQLLAVCRELRDDWCRKDSSERFIDRNELRSDRLREVTLEQISPARRRTLHRRVPEPASGDEVDRLARTMNHMLDRLELASVRQRRSSITTPRSL